MSLKQKTAQQIFSLVVFTIVAFWLLPQTARAQDPSQPTAGASQLGGSAAPAGRPQHALVAPSKTSAESPAGPPAAQRPAKDRLGPLDWLVLVLYGLGMIAVGWYYSRRSKTSDDYLLGGRRMSPVAVGLSLFATLISTISYLSIPGEMVTNGPIILAQITAYPLILVIVGWFQIPFFMRLRVTSAYEILEIGLGRTVRLVGSVLFLALRLLWMGLIVYATTDKAILPFLRIDESYAPLVAVVVCLATMAYTTLGGFKAVVVTDVLQSLILFAAAILSVAYVTLDLGGITSWWPSAWMPHWQQPAFWFDPGVRLTYMGAFMNALLWYVCTNGSDQMAIQRFLATRDARSARRVLTVSLVADGLVMLLLSVMGVALLAYFTTHHELLPPGVNVAQRGDRLFPDFILLVLPTGVTGFVVAGILSAAMSSLSSGLSASTSVVAVDLLGHSGSESDAAQVRTERWISVAIGCVVVLLSLGIGRLTGNLIDLGNKVVSLFSAPLFVLFVAALWLPSATPFGALAGLTVSAATAMAISVFEVFGLSFLWTLPLALSTGIVTCILASQLPIGQRPAAKDRLL